MKYILNTIILIFILINNSYSQTAINWGIGYSLNGSGDLSGFCLETGVTLNSDQLISYNIELKTSINNREQSLYYIHPNGDWVNSSYRLINHGTQIELLPQINILKINKLSPFIALGGLVRYTISNDYKQMAYLFPSLTLYPIPLIALDVYDKQNYFSIGYIAKIGVNYQFSAKSNFSLSTHFQNDTKGNMVWSIPLRYSYTIK